MKRTILAAAALGAALAAFGDSPSIAEKEQPYIESLLARTKEIHLPKGTDLTPSP